MAESMRELMLKIRGDVSELKAALGKGKTELDGFSRHAKQVGSEIKGALAMVGVGIGIAVLVGKLKELAFEMARIGARTETLRVAMYAVGKNAGLSAESLDFFTNQVKAVGITTQESMSAITKFIQQGLPLTGLKDLATRARDLAVIAGKNTSETLSGIVHGIVTQQTEVLRTYGINVGSFEEIFKQYAATIGKTGKELNAVERAQAALNAVLERSKMAAGAAAAADETVGKQLQSLQRYAETAKEAFFEFFGPIMVRVIQQTTQMWKDLYTWATNNKQALREWGDAIGEWVKSTAEAIRSAVVWLIQNKELIKTLIAFAILMKVATWVALIGASVKTLTVGLYGLATGVKAIELAFGGWLGTLIKVAAVLAVIGMYKAGQMAKTEEGVLHGMMLGEAAGLAKEEIKPLQEKDQFQGYEEPTGVTGQKTQAQKEAAAIVEANEAVKKSIEEANKVAKTGADKKKGAEKDFTNFLIGEVNARRKLRIEELEADLAVFRAVNETRKAELERDLLNRKITAAEYYAAIEQMERESIAKQIQILEERKAAEIDAYLKSKSLLEQTTRDPVRLAAELARLELDHKTKMIDLEKQLNVVREQGVTREAQKTLQAAQARDQITDQIKDLQYATAATPQEKIEAEINRLLDEQIKKREALVKLIAAAVQGGALTPDQAAATLAQYDALLAKQRSLAGVGVDAERWSQQITQGISSFIDCLAQGGADIVKGLNSFFTTLYREALVPGFNQLKTSLQGLLTNVFGSIGSWIGNALLGMIGFIGAMLSSGGAGSYTSAGIQSAVTGTERVRGIVAGEDTIAVAKVNLGLKEALGDTNAILLRIEDKIGAGGGGATNIAAAVKAGLEAYFAEALQTQPA